MLPAKDAHRLIINGDKPIFSAESDISADVVRFSSLFIAVVLDILSLFSHGVGVKAANRNTDETNDHNLLECFVELLLAFSLLGAVGIDFSATVVLCVEISLSILLKARIGGRLFGQLFILRTGVSI